MKFSQLFASVLATLLFWNVAPASAADFWSPRTAALGGAGRAGPLLNDAIYLNPSFISLLPTYSISLNYAPFSTGGGSTQGHILNLGIQDGRTELFQAGVGFTSRRDARFIHVGASKRIGDPWGVGIGSKFVLSDGRVNSLTADLTAATTFIAAPWLHLVGVIDNLLESSNGQLRGLYREFALGTKVNFKGIAMLYVDPHYTPSLPSDQFGISAGAEFTMFQDLFARVGLFRKTAMPYLGGTRGDGWGAGFGWIAPRLSLDYGYSKSTDPSGTFSHHLGATVYF